MRYFFYKLKTFFQEIPRFFLLRLHSLKEEYRYEREVFEIRKEYNSVLKDMISSKVFRKIAALCGTAIVAVFFLIEGGSLLAQKVASNISTVPVVEANVAPAVKAKTPSELPQEKPVSPAVAVVTEPVAEPSTPVETVKATTPEVITQKVALHKVAPKPQVATVPPEERYIILVDKEKKVLRLAEFINGAYLVVEKFNVSIGQLMGDKRSEGDLKTPEGRYKILKVKTDAELDSQYGPFAFVLNYPNERDRARGKTGYGIWIHGSGSNTRSPETKGCIELGNADLVRLRNYIQVETPVYIFPSDPVGISDERIDLASIDTLKHFLDTL